MKIDWFTFFAQIVNFLVLVWLLRRFLYGPIVGAMQQRENRIAAQLEDAAQKRSEADKKVEQYEQKNREIDEQREELLREARREVHELRERLTREARDEVEQKREVWLHAFDRERDEMLDEVRHQIGQLAEDATRQTLSELASVDLEERMFREFISRMQHVDGQQREEIRAHLGNGGAEVVVRTAFDVTEEWRDRLQELIRQKFGHHGDVSFEKSKVLICGLELDVGGYSFGWNVKDFVRQMRLDFGEQLTKKT